MASQSDYELSQKYFFYHKDGLLDIFIGLGILLAGVSMWAGMVWLAGSWVAVFLPLWIVARKSITFRYGSDLDTSAGKNINIGLTMMVIFGVLLLCAMLGLMSAWGFDKLESVRSFVDAYIHLIVGGGLALFLAFTAVFMHIQRYLLYAILAIAAFLLGQAFGWPFWISMSLGGGLIFLAGLFVLIGFLRTHSTVS